MPVLATIRHRFGADRPLEGSSIGACLHVTAETAVLLRTLQEGGAAVSVCASNPLSTRDDVAAWLVGEAGIDTFARRGDDASSYLRHIDAVLDHQPTLTVDDGCDLLARLHSSRPEQAAGVRAGTEDTTTGALRLRALAASGGLAYPVLDVSGAATRALADNRHGTGQSALDGIVRATNVLLAGARVVVAGYGNCGRGVAERARGLGAIVTVTEVDPSRALQAVMDGFRVETMVEAAASGQIFVTATGNRDVIGREAIERMPDGAMLANAGHFDVEIDLSALDSLARGRRRPVRAMVEEYLVDGPSGRRRILLLAEGRLVNLGAADGNPPQVMDLSFAVQALACEWLAGHHGELQPGVHEVPPSLDATVARLKLETMGVALDVLTRDQERYLASWGGPT